MWQSEVNISGSLLHELHTGISYVLYTGTEMLTDKPEVT